MIAIFGFAALASVADALRQQPAVAAITFTVDSTADVLPQGRGVITPLSLRVTVAGGRGRIDVLAVPSRPAIRIGDVVVGAPVAAPGDYYLFDSTGFTLVKFRERTSVRYILSDAAFNYEGRRDGWPGMFRAAPMRAETVGLAAPPTLGDVRLFWHMDVARDSSCALGDCSIEELARGRMTLVNAPASEVVVARWIGPALALARLPGGTARLAALPLRVTTVSPYTGIHFLRELRATTVDPALLDLPR